MLVGHDVEIVAELAFRHRPQRGRWLKIWNRLQRGTHGRTFRFWGPFLALARYCSGGASVTKNETIMPERKTIEKARRDRRAGKSPSTQAGEFVHEEIRKIRRGQHGARSPQQAIAIGLSEARRAGVRLPPPGKGKAKAKTRRSAEYAYEAGQGKRKTRRRPRVSRAVERTLKREPRSTASRAALSKQSQRAASRRSASSRSAAARKAAKTKGPARRSAAARKAARTRARRRG
jgi:hypothetical protein